MSSGGGVCGRRCRSRRPAGVAAASAGLREDDLLRCEVRAAGVADVQPDCLRVLRVAAPPGRVLVGTGRQLFPDDLGHLGEGHLDPWTPGCRQVPFQALVLLASDHDDIMPGGPNGMARQQCHVAIGNWRRPEAWWMALTRRPTL